MTVWTKRLVVCVAFLVSFWGAPILAQQVVRVFGTTSTGTILAGLVDSSGRLLVSVAGGTISPTNIDLVNTTSATTGVITKAGTRFVHNFADPTALGFNTFVGVSAGNFTLSPAGGANTLASYNTGVGTSVLGSLTTGYSNTAMGISALGGATTGYFNTAIGADAMAFTTITGSSNTGIGGDALYAVTSAVGNSAMGVRSMDSVQDGAENVGLGVDTLQANVSGDKNVALGNLALTLATADNNIAIGYNAGANITTASNTITIGHNLAADSATADAQLNLGGVIKADLGTQVVTFPGAISVTGNGGAIPHALIPTIIGSIAANGDLDLKGTSHATKTTSYLTLQQTGGLVGIGTATPLNVLHVQSALDDVVGIYSTRDVAAAFLQQLHWNAGVGNVANGDANVVRFSQDSSTTADAILADIRVISTNVTHATRQSAIAFFTQASGAASPTEAGRFDSTGQLSAASVRGTAVAFASVPATPVEGMLVAVTNSSTSVWGAACDGAGALHVLCYYNGSAWTVAGK